EEGTLRGLLRTALPGQAPVVFVAGEAGVGKTALVEHVLARIGVAGAGTAAAGLAASGSAGSAAGEAGGLVLRGRAVGWYSAAYQPVADVIRAALACVPGPPDGILSVILPELGPPPPDVSLPAVASAVCAVL